MSSITHEIDSQPSCWRAAAGLVAAAAELLPHGGRAVLVGCGTSYNVALALASLREARGLGETDAFTASEMPSGRRYSHLLAISRSGTTTEVQRLLASVGPDTRTAVITAVSATPITDAAERSLVLDFVDERAVVQTRFATTVVALLRAHFGEDIAPVAAELERALSAPLPVEVERFRQFVFLGRGWTVGLAHEAALKVREAAAAWAESYPAMEFRHGPISVPDEDSLVWSLGEVEPELLAEAEATGATVVADGLDPLAELVQAQRLAVELAARRGLDPDSPRRLSRSVVLA
ncbi:MAG: SIS domain-containing protein [Actinomycetota bacterium]